MELEIVLEGKDMSRFLLRHTYTHISGILGLLVSIGSLIALVAGWGNFSPIQRVVLGLVGATFTVFQPLTLWSKGRSQMVKSSLDHSFHYSFLDDELIIAMGEQKESFPWEKVRKVVYGKNAVYIYMTAISAFIIPADKCENFQEVKDLLKEKTNGI
jgi:hypothetical protein